MTAFILVSGEVRDECVQPGMDALKQGASGMDVAEMVARAVESDVNEHFVGFSGLPNVLGEVELDASIMDGATLAAGAVAALKGYLHPISVARQVMERLPHVLLVDQGAAHFAHDIRAEKGDLLTPEAREIWLQRLRAILRDLGLEIGDYEASSPASLQALISAHSSLIAVTRKALKYNEGGDTMNVIVRDAAGHIVSAVTTSGVAWKYPGRVGDSPIIGAGHYVDDRYGAAANTGWGELAIRQGTALRAVMMLRAGMPMQQAGREAIRDLRYVKETEKAWLRMLLVDGQGNIGGYCTQPDATLKVMATDDISPRIIPCEHVV